MTGLDKHLALAHGVRPEAKPIKAKAAYDFCCPDCQEMECECDDPRPKAHTKPVRGCMNCDFIVIMSDDQRGYCQVHGDINGGPSDEW